MKYLPVFILFLLLNSCTTSYKILSDYERDTKFSNYQSFEILPHPHGFPLGANPINKQRINRAIQNEMKDLNFLSTPNPDLLVSWFVKIKDVRYTEVYHNHYSRWSYGNRINIVEYQEGTLVIDLIDRVNEKVIWHGKTSGRVYEDMPDVEGKINKAINAMFQKMEKDFNLRKSIAIK